MKIEKEFLKTSNREKQLFFEILRKINDMIKKTLLKKQSKHPFNKTSLSNEKKQFFFEVFFYWGHRLHAVSKSVQEDGKTFLQLNGLLDRGFVAFWSVD